MEKNYSRPSLPTKFKSFYLDGCNGCPIGEGGLPIRPRGNLSARVALIGEAPGKIEEEENCFFTGPAGSLFIEILAGIGLKPDKDFFFLNAVQCRPNAPPGSKKENRTPLKDEVIKCRPNLRALLEVQVPELLVAVGGVGLSALLDTSLLISKAAGTFLSPNSLVKDIGVHAPVYSVYHPSYILRNPGARPEWTSQLIKLRDYMISGKLISIMSAPLVG